MKWYTKTAIALGFVGAVGMAAAAFAQTGSSSPSPTPTASQRAQVRIGLGRRVVHGDLELQTRRGIANATVDTGTITAIDHAARTVTIKRADGKTVSFTVPDRTRVRRDRERVDFNALKAGDFAQVIQIDRGEGFVVVAIRARSADATASAPATAL